MSRKTLLAAAALAASTAPALAYAELDRAEPRVGSTVTVAPEAVVLNFSEELGDDGASGEVRDVAGARVDIGGLTLDEHDRRRARLAVGRLPPGEYTVRWWAKTADGDLTQGRFLFVIAR
jgi:copper resistance protein C